MGTEFIVPTGEIIKDYLSEYDISQKELAVNIGMSEKHVSNVLSGKARLMEEFALRLEYVIKDVPASYWLNYESKYREYIAREKMHQDIKAADLKNIKERFCFDDVFKGLDWDIQKQAVEMLKLLNISSFDNFYRAYDNLSAAFMEDGGGIEAIAIWLKLCEEQIDLQNNLITDDYDPQRIRDAIESFKAIALSKTIEGITVNCKKLCNRLGVYLVLYPTIKNSKVRGAIETFRGHPAIFLSGRFKTHDNVWFAFFHELGHLLYHYDKRYEAVSMEDDLNNMEEVANQFARDILISKPEYEEFVSDLDVDNKELTEQMIRTFAMQQAVLPGVVVARLQHDRFLPYSMCNNLKNKIKPKR